MTLDIFKMLSKLPQSPTHFHKMFENVYYLSNALKYSFVTLNIFTIKRMTALYIFKVYRVLCTVQHMRYNDWLKIPLQIYIPDSMFI
jgi:hypothetical protein